LPDVLGTPNTRVLVASSRNISTASSGMLGALDMLGVMCERGRFKDRPWLLEVKER